MTYPYWVDLNVVRAPASADEIAALLKAADGVPSRGTWDDDPNLIRELAAVIRQLTDRQRIPETEGDVSDGCANCLRVPPVQI